MTANNKKEKEDYKSFFDRVSPILSPDDLFGLNEAYEMAKEGHRWQRREREIDPETGKPVRYFEHPRAVALILMDEVRCMDLHMLQAALLHDGLEDARKITEARIERRLGKEVVRIVKLLSKGPKNVPKEAYYERLMTFADWKTLMVKACDRLHNLRTLGPDKVFQKKQIDETKAKYYPVLDRLVDIAPPEWSKGAMYLRCEIKKIVRSYSNNFATTSAKAAAKSRRPR